MRRHAIIITMSCLAVTSIAAADFTAFNDFLADFTTDTNVTQWGYDNSGAQALVDHATGNTVTPTMTTTYYHMSHSTTGPAGEIANGTDAADLFGGIVSTKNRVDAYNSSYLGDWYVEVAFASLDPTKTYNLAAVLDRGSTSYTNQRWTLISIEDADASTYACSSGTYQVSSTAVSIDSYNTQNGYIAQWTGIQPGADGDMTLRFAPATDDQLPEAFRTTNADGRGYGPAGIMLQEVPEPASMALLGISGLAFLCKRRKK